MVKSRAVVTSLLLSTLLVSSIKAYSASPPKPGATCSKLGTSQTYKGKKFTCIKSGKKLVWNKGVSIIRIQPSPAVSPTQTPTPVSSPSSSPSISPSPSSTPTPSPTPSPSPTKPVFALTEMSKFQSMSTCQISSTVTAGNSEHLGFPRPKDVIPSQGEHRAITLFVYFDDLSYEQKQIDEWKNNQIPTFERFAQSMSYGKLKFKVDTYDQFLHIKKSVLAYNLDTAHSAPMKPNADAQGLIRDAVAAADPYVDFSKYTFINVVTAATNKIGFEGALAGPDLATADGVQFKRATFGPIREYVDDPAKKIWLLHEVGHLWGLIHPFNTDGSSWGRPGYPKFSVMGDGKSRAPEFLAWERFVLNWFTEDQVACISTPSESEYTVKVSDIAPNASGIKMLTIKLSSTEAIVLESRKASRDSLISPDEEGIFAYYIDTSIRSNVGAIKVIYKENPPASGWYPSTLTKGDKGVFRNYIIEILDSDSSGEIVKVTIKK